MGRIERYPDRLIEIFHDFIVDMRSPSKEYSVFPTVQSVRLEAGRGRTTFGRPVPSTSQNARQFREKDVGPARHPPSPTILVHLVMSQFLLFVLFYQDI